MYYAGMVIIETITPSPSSQLRSWVERESGQKIFRCYQCGKCTAGCPAAYTMDLTPRQIMRAVQFGLKEEVLKSNTIWVCLHCQTCSARCPQEIDVAKVMESLRLLAVMEKGKAAVEEVKIFHDAFLSNLWRFGRIYELGLGASYNLRSRHFLTNLSMLPGMLSRGKLPILPRSAKGTSRVKAIFSQVYAKEKESEMERKGTA